MKWFKNVSKFKLTVGNDLIIPEDERCLDETNPKVIFHKNAGYLMEMTDSIHILREHSEVHKSPNTGTMDVHVEPSKVKEAPKVEASRPSISATFPGGKETQEPPKMDRYKFAGDEGSVIEKGKVPGEGQEKSVSTFIKDGITAGNKELGSVTDNAGMAIAQKPKEEKKK